MPKRYLDYLIDSSLTRVNRLFALKFDNNTNREGHLEYHLPTIKMIDYNVMIDEKRIFWSLNKK